MGFLPSLTKVAMEFYRNSIGYEIDEGLLELIKKKIGYQEGLHEHKNYEIEITLRDDRIKAFSLRR